MTRLLRGVGVLAFLVLGVACGGGSMDGAATPAVDLASHQPAAHIVCDAEDPCPKGFLCISHLRCAKTCTTNSDCPTGQTCSGSLGGKTYCR
ncbi:MAG TPA: hypothetical protein VMT11_01155 [Myxococcaceae bacterium]|nr:hypothetical protein [Myxococcaceae bacterium]